MANAAEPGTRKPLRERFRLMTEYVEDGVAVIENGRIALANERLCELLGYSRWQLLRMSDLDLAAPEEKQRLQQMWHEDEGQELAPLEVEFWAVHRDGSRRYIRNWYGSGPDGKRDARLFVVISDITEKKLPTERPAEEESFLRQIIDASPDLVFVKDSDGRYVLVNRSYAEACRREPEEFVGRDDLEMGWPEELVEGDPESGIQGSRAEERAVMDSAQSRSVPGEWLWIGGQRRRYATTRMPLRDAEGNVWGLMGFARRVTDREQVLAQTDLLRDVSQALAAVDDAEGLLRAAVAPAMRAGADAAMLLYLDVDGDGKPEWAEVVAAMGPTTFSVGTRLYLSSLPRFRLFLSGSVQPLTIADLDATRDGTGAEVRRLMRPVQARAVAVLPLGVGQRWQGMVVITWPAPHEFGPEEEQFYQFIGSQLMARVQAQRIQARAGHRARWSQTAAEVSQAAASILDLDELLQRLVNLIHDRFGLYYAGLLLVDREASGAGERGEWAVLRAGTGEAGEQMVEQGHKLQIGGGSVIGQCLASKQPRLAMDVGEESVRFTNPWLPDTRTELALPLVSRGEAVGALSIHSEQPAAFTEEDVTVLQTMADQLAIAIDNARLIGQAQARAQREQLVRTISERIRRGGDREAILRITLEEMSRMLGASKAIIRLGTQAQLGAGPGDPAADEE